jgi:cyclase
MDADGTKSGYDLPLISFVREQVTVPIIASGGAGRLDDFVPAVRAGADAVLAASIFHFGEVSIDSVKMTLATAGLPVRAMKQARPELGS